jgi:hypothetical protein
VTDREDLLGDHFGNWTSSPEGITPRNPNLPVPPPEPGRPLGIFSGKPTPEWPFPPPIWGLPDNSNASGNSDGDWFTSLAGVLDGAKSGASLGRGSGHSSPRRAPQIAQGSTPSPLLEYIQSLKQLDGNKPQASAIDTRAPAATLVPPDEPNFMGGIAGRIAALAGIDPQNPDQFAPPVGGVLGGLAGRLAALAGIAPQNPNQFAPSPQDNQLRGFYNDDPTQPWFVRGRR